jgi:hypothetical protein
MPNISIDFSDVSSGFEALKQGEYDVVVEKVELREGSGDHPYLNWTLSVTEDGEYRERKLWFITSFAPKALWRMKETFENIGIFEDNMAFNIDEDTNALLEPQVVGLPARAVVVVEPYQGRETNKVKTLLPPEGSSPAGRKTQAAGSAPAKATGGGLR